MQTFDVIAGCATDKGVYREKNQDRIISLTAGSGKNILTLSCICDGIGSLKMSEIASEMMTSGLSVWLNRVKDYYPEIMNGTDMADSLEEEIKRLNESIYEYRMSCENAIGCTMSVIFTAGDDYYIFHVGDSRIYLVSDVIKQLTRDEVVVKEKNGIVKEFLANYVAKQKNIWMVRTGGKIKPGNMYIIGSDGLFKKLCNEDISSVSASLSQKNIEKTCFGLIQTVRERGETDNVSCALVYAAPRKRLLWRL